MTRYYRIGARGTDVETIQMALNTKLKPSHNLVVDGQFGRNTYLAVVAFQRMNGLQMDGIVGPNTGSLIFVTEDAGYLFIDHRIRLIPQPTDMTCWAASVAMVNRTTVKQVKDKTPKDLIGKDGGISNFSPYVRSPTGFANSLPGNQRFADIHKLRYYPPQTYTFNALIDLIKAGPIIVSELNSEKRYRTKWGSPGHQYVIGGFQTNKGPYGYHENEYGINSADRSIRVINPWPPKVGNARWSNFDFWMSNRYGGITEYSDSKVIYGIFAK